MLKTKVGRAPSLGKQLLRGLLWAVGWTIASSLGAAWLVDREVLALENIGYVSLLILLVCGFLLARKGSAGAGKGRIIGAAAATGAYYLCLMLVNWLFFGGNFAGFGVTLIVLGLGAALGCLEFHQGRGGVSRRRYKIPKS